MINREKPELPGWARLKSHAEQVFNKMLQSNGNKGTVPLNDILSAQNGEFKLFEQIDGNEGDAVLSQAEWMERLQKKHADKEAAGDNWLEGLLHSFQLHSDAGVQGGANVPKLNLKGNLLKALKQPEKKKDSGDVGCESDASDDEYEMEGQTIREAVELSDGTMIKEAIKKANWFGDEKKRKGGILKGMAVMNQYEKATYLTHLDEAELPVALELLSLGDREAFFGILPETDWIVAHLGFVCRLNPEERER